MTQSKRVVFFGNERLVSGLRHSSTPVLLGLIERGYDVACVVVNNSDAVSRTARTLEVSEIAKAHEIPVLSPNRPSDIIEQLASYNADFAILAAYGRIIPQRVIDVFSPIGIINIHPSLLPRHRGPTPIESTITSGDTKAGVSIMQLASGMDEGPTYGQVTYDMHGSEDKFELCERLSTIGAELLFDLLPGIINGSVVAKPQQNTGVTYTTLISKKDGIVDPTTETATEISRKVRAHLGFPKSKLHYKNYDVIITSAKAVDMPTERHFCISCPDTTLLIETLIAPNGKSMTGDAYLRGLR
jgi:methionyl-tRNA formyltransferase